MSVALQKIDGVEAVKVTLNEGKASLTLKPRNKVTLAEVRKVIERNGFTPRAAAIVAVAEQVTGTDRPTSIRITGVGETFPIAPATSEGIRSELKKQAATPFIVEGIVPPAKDDPAGSIDIKAIKPAAK